MAQPIKSYLEKFGSQEARSLYKHSSKVTGKEHTGVTERKRTVGATTGTKSALSSFICQWLSRITYKHTWNCWEAKANGMMGLKDLSHFLSEAV